jgi:hypothetical protein
MVIPFIALVVLLVLGREELDPPWLWGIWGFLALALVMVFIFKLFPMFFVVPVVLVDVALIIKLFGGDITIR